MSLRRQAARRTPISAERKRGGLDKQVGNAIRNSAKGSTELYQAVATVDPTGVANLNRTVVNNSLGLASDEEVYSAMGSAAINTAATIYTPGKGLKILSRIGDVPGLSKAAEVAGASVQKGLDSLVGQLANGNLNPGKGTKKLFGSISYARSDDGARVYFRQAGGTIEILAKSNKKNQGKVIRMLEDAYEK